jgi:tryptophan-rich sensory protein
LEGWGAIFGLLALACALLAWQSMAGGKTRHWLSMVGFAAIIAVTMYVMLDLEFPHPGLIGGEAFEQALVDLLGRRQ